MTKKMSHETDEYLEQYGKNLSTFLRQAYPRPVYHFEHGSDEFIDDLIDAFDALPDKAKKALEPYTIISLDSGKTHTDTEAKTMQLVEGDDVPATLVQREVSKILGIQK